MSFVKTLLVTPHRITDHDQADEFLLVLAMQVIMQSDAELRVEKASLMSTLARTLPDFDRLDFDALQAHAREHIDHHAAQLFNALGKEDIDDIPETEQHRIILRVLLRVVDELHAIQSRPMREKCFALAAELAAVPGEISDNDDKLLARLYDVLALDRDTAQMILEVMTLKYRPL